MTIELDIAWDRAKRAEEDAALARGMLSAAKVDIIRLESRVESLERQLAFSEHELAYERGTITTREYYQETQEEIE